MISQLPSIAGFEWVMGLGLMFGLAFALTLITTKNLETFLVFLTVMDVFGL
jgi:hypothetical protein